MMMMAVCLAMPADASTPASALRKRLLKLEKRAHRKSSVAGASPSNQPNIVTTR